MIAVDIAGSESTPQPVYFDPKEPEPRIIPLLKAEITFRYDDLDDVTDAQQRAPRLFLRIDDPLARAAVKAGEQPMRLQQHGSRYHLVFRREVAVSGGIFGVDALTQARHRPAPAELKEILEGRDDEIFVTLMNDPPSVLPDDPEGISPKIARSDRFQPLEIHFKPPTPTAIRGRAYFQVEKKKNLTPEQVYRGLLKFLRTAPGAGDYLKELEAFRVGVERLDCKREKPDELLERPSTIPGTTESGISGTTESGFLFADLSLLVAPPVPKDSEGKPKPVNDHDRVPVETMVETFEHPRRARFDALAFDDVDGEGGRISVLHPKPHAKLGLSGFEKTATAGNDGPFVRFVDSKRRTGTRIRWNSRPTMKPGSGLKDVADPVAYWRLAGGFDVFETDLSELIRMTDVADYARRVARVQRLPDDQRSLDPAEIVDFEKVEAYYPSESIRRSAAQEIRRADEKSAWYSPAETLLCWPQFGLRRSVAIAAIEAELMPLFDKGCPTHILIEFDKANVPWAYEGDTPLVEFERAGDPSVKQPQDGFEVEGGGKWNGAALAKLLRDLVWTVISDVAAKNLKDKYFDFEKPDTLSNLTLKLKGNVVENNRVIRTTGETSITVDLNPQLHPFIADVVDCVRWKEEEDGRLYRLYEPVLDPAPPTKAETFDDFMNERPAERDPYGWAFLRTVGLSTGIKLFDMEKSEFVGPEETIELLSKAIYHIRPRYRNNLELGQPLVEIITRPDGLTHLSSFDSAIPDAGKDPADFMKHQALSLLQISLRPVPEQLLLRDKELPECVGYLELKVSANCESIHVAPEYAPGPNGGVLYEVINVANGLAGGSPVALINSKDEAAKALFGANAVNGLDMRLGGPADGSVALIRVTAIGAAELSKAIAKGTGINVTGTNCIPDSKFSFELILRKEPSALRIDAVQCPAKKRTASDHDPFGRFPPLRAEVLALLLSKQSYKDSNNKPQTVDPKPGAGRELNHILTAIARRFTKQSKAELFEKVEPGNKAGFMSKLQQFTSRLITHGPCDTADGTPFALATVTRPDPWRVAPSHDGTMDILLVHDDAWARRRRYVVRPFGRYENIEMAMDARSGDPNAAGHREIEPPSLTGIIGKLDETFAARSVDITTPRTHPVRSPAILSARRLDRIIKYGEKDDPPRDLKRRREGRLLEYVLARHSEEIISESNRLVADSYQFDHVGIAFYQEFTAPRWANGLMHASGFMDIELVPELATGNPRPEPLQLFFKETVSRRPGTTPSRPMTPRCPTASSTAGAGSPLCEPPTFLISIGCTRSRTPQPASWYLSLRPQRSRRGARSRGCHGVPTVPTCSGPTSRPGRCGGTTRRFRS